MNSRSLFAELKRRNVYRVAVAYAVAAWLLIQVSSILLVTTFQAPPWVMKALVAVLALGFPVTLVWSWAFEITPEGAHGRCCDIDYPRDWPKNCQHHRCAGGSSDRLVCIST